MGDRADSLPHREVELLSQREFPSCSHREDAKERRDEEDEGRNQAHGQWVMSGLVVFLAFFASFAVKLFLY
jgi:hypothetical protein